MKRDHEIDDVEEEIILDDVEEQIVAFLLSSLALYEEIKNKIN